MQVIESKVGRGISNSGDDETLEGEADDGVAVLRGELVCTKTCFISLVFSNSTPWKILL